MTKITFTEEEVNHITQAYIDHYQAHSNDNDQSNPKDELKQLLVTGRGLSDTTRNQALLDAVAYTIEQYPSENMVFSYFEYFLSIIPILNFITIYLAKDRLFNDSLLNTLVICVTALIPFGLFINLRIKDKEELAKQANQANDEQTQLMEFIENPNTNPTPRIKTLFANFVAESMTIKVRNGELVVPFDANIDTNNIVEYKNRNDLMLTMSRADFTTQLGNALGMEIFPPFLLTASHMQTNRTYRALSKCLEAKDLPKIVAYGRGQMTGDHHSLLNEKSKTLIQESSVLLTELDDHNKIVTMLSLLNSDPNEDRPIRNLCELYPCEVISVYLNIFNRFVEESRHFITADGVNDIGNIDSKALQAFLKIDLTGNEEKNTQRRDAIINIIRECQNAENPFIQLINQTDGKRHMSELANMLYSPYCTDIEAVTMLMTEGAEIKYNHGEASDALTLIEEKQRHALLAETMTPNQETALEAVAAIKDEMWRKANTLLTKDNSSVNSGHTTPPDDSGSESGSESDPGNRSSGSYFH